MKEWEIKQSEKFKEQYNNSAQFRAYILTSSYKSQDKKKGFDISDNADSEFIENMFKGGCVYCGEKDWHELGLDRIDNSKGHSKDNVVCACKLCNWVRNSKFSFQEMLMLGETIRNIKKLRNQSPN